MTIKLLVVRIASFTFLVCPHYTGNRFSCRHENVSGSMNDNRIELEQVVHTYRTLHQSGRLAERPVWCTKSQSSLLTFTFISLAPSPYSFYLKNCSHCDEKWQRPIRYVMIHFSRSAAAQFRSLRPSQFNASFPIARPTHFFGKVKKKKNSKIICKETSTLIYKHTILSY